MGYPDATLVALVKTHRSLTRQVGLTPSKFRARPYLQGAEETEGAFARCPMRMREYWCCHRAEPRESRCYRSQIKLAWVDE